MPTMEGRSEQRLTLPQLGGAFALFFLAAILPRIGLIASGYAFADDFAVDYRAYLESYRPLLAADLLFWQSLYGSDYILSALPRVMSAFWYALAGTSLLAFAVRIGCSLRVSVLLGVIALLHPAFNELILWGVLASTPFSLFLVILGAHLILFAPFPSARLIGLLPLILGSMGNQLATSAGLVLAILVWIVSQTGTRLDKPKLAPLLLVSVIPPLVSIASLVVIRFGFGIEDFASRSISVESDLHSFASSKFYVLSNSFANLYQAPLAILLGEKTTMKAFWPMALGLPIATFLLLRQFCGISTWRSFLLSVSPNLVFFIALFPLLGTTTTPTGYRLLGPVLCLLVLPAAVVARALVASHWTRLLAISLTAVFGSACAVATLTDISVRSEAWRRDAQWIAQVDARRAASGSPSVAICAGRFKDPVNPGRGILENYRTRTVDSYSVWYTQFLRAYAARSKLGTTLAAAPAHNLALPGTERTVIGGVASGVWTARGAGNALELCGMEEVP